MIDNLPVLLKFKLSTMKSQILISTEHMPKVQWQHAAGGCVAMLGHHRSVGFCSLSHSSYCKGSTGVASITVLCACFPVSDIFYPFYYLWRLREYVSAYSWGAGTCTEYPRISLLPLLKMSYQSMVLSFQRPWITPWYLPDDLCCHCARCLGGSGVIALHPAEAGEPQSAVLSANVEGFALLYSFCYCDQEGEMPAWQA